ncbi:PIN-like domain-containing protein [Desulfosporosinus metallidurans]|nr:PIN-like domain-containing protein [Desulfosporosinus metallidurans]
MDAQVFKRLWSEAIISLDTSALVFLQECNVELAKCVMDTLLFVEKRIWISNHVAAVEMSKNFEYKGDRSGALGRLNKFHKTLDNSVTKMSEVFKSLSNELYEEGHGLLADVVSSVDMNEVFYDLLSDFNQRMDSSTKENREFLLSGLVQVFQKSICSKSSSILTDEELKNIQSIGAARYSDRIPPGYCDWDKDSNEFGDLIVWQEIMKKSHLDKIPMLFITRDKKEDWFKIEHKEIIGVRDELINEAKESGAEIFVIYFNDFVRMSSELVSKNVEALIDKLDREDGLLLEIEDYLHENIYGEIQDKLSEIANTNCNSDFVMVDTVQGVEITDRSYEIFDDYVVINCRVEFEVSVDHNFHYDSKEPNMELSGDVFSQLDARISINLLSGHHDEENKTLDIDSVSIEFDDVEVIDSSDPFGHEDEDYEEPEEFEHEEHEDYEYEESEEFEYEEYED